MLYIIDPGPMQDCITSDTQPKPETTKGRIYRAFDVKGKRKAERLTDGHWVPLQEIPNQTPIKVLMAAGIISR